MACLVAKVYYKKTFSTMVRFVSVLPIPAIVAKDIELYMICISYFSKEN